MAGARQWQAPGGGRRQAAAGAMVVLVPVQGIYSMLAVCAGRSCAARLLFVRSLELSKFMSLHNPLGVRGMGVPDDMQAVEQLPRVLLCCVHFALLCVIAG